MKKEDGRSLHTLWNEQTYKLRERRYYPPAAMDNLARIGNVWAVRRMKCRLLPEIIDGESG